MASLQRDDDEQSALLGASLSEQEEDEDHARQVASWSRLAWWKRPSPYCLIFAIPIASIGNSALFSPKVAMYTSLVCRVHRPEYGPRHNPVSMNAADSVSPVFGLDDLSVLLPRPAYTENEPNSQQKCASDPVVQAIVARLNAVFDTTMGVLSCITTGWWGSLSDRSGRRIAVFVPMLGFFISDVIHLVTAWFVDVLPGGYWFPLVGFLIDGLCGSIPASVAINHAYLSDTTSPSTRSRYFSLFLGAMYTGVAVGPVLGGLLIRSTGSILSVFYFSPIMHGVYIILVLLILPESLTRARARGARLRRKQEKANQAPGGRVLSVLKCIGNFLSPLVVLLPVQSFDANTAKRRSKDWNLFFIAIAYGLVASILGSVSYKIQYAAAQFSWTPELTSYFVSYLGATRCIFLALILPFVIKYLKPASVQLPSTSDEDEPLRGAIGASTSTDTTLPPGSARTNVLEQPPATLPSFDLALARVSASLESVSFLSMSLASTGTLFTVAGTIGGAAAGFPAAAQALALDIYTNHRSQNRGEVGKMFGALSVVQALGSQIVSPALYGFVYFNTVAVFPQAILIVSTCTTLLALAFLSFVRIPPKHVGDRVAPGHGDEEGNGSVRGS